MVARMPDLTSGGRPTSCIDHISVHYSLCDSVVVHRCEHAFHSKHLPVVVDICIHKHRDHVRKLIKRFTLIRGDVYLQEHNEIQRLGELEHIL